MKVLLATYWHLPHLGGVWPFMSQLKQGLEARGHQVDLMGNGGGTTTYHIVNNGKELLKERLLPLLRTKLTEHTVSPLYKDPWINYFERDRYCMELTAAYFGLNEYDIIHTQDVISTRALSRVKPKGTPLIANIHGSLARELRMQMDMDSTRSEYEKYILMEYMYRMEHYGAVSADVVISANQWLKRVLTNEFAVPEQKFNIFQYGLDTDTFWQKWRQGTPLVKPVGKKLIICPARLAYIKGIHHLINALGVLKSKRTNDWVCWIAGEGDKRDELTAQAASLGLQEYVLFLGQREDIPGLLGISDICVHPSVQDNQPFSVMEAQTAGLPSVVSDAGGLPEMVQHEVTGLVHQMGDAEEMASHLDFLLENDYARKAMGREAKRFAEKHWSMDLMIERFLHTYHTALEAYRREGR